MINKFVGLDILIVPKNKLISHNSTIIQSLQILQTFPNLKLEKGNHLMYVIHVLHSSAFLIAGFNL